MGPSSPSAPGGTGALSSQESLGSLEGASDGHPRAVPSPQRATFQGLESETQVRSRAASTQPPLLAFSPAASPCAGILSVRDTGTQLPHCELTLRLLEWALGWPCRAGSLSV